MLTYPIILITTHSVVYWRDCSLSHGYAVPTTAGALTRFRITAATRVPLGVLDRDQRPLVVFALHVTLVWKQKPLVVPSNHGRAVRARVTVAHVGVNGLP